ncbi:MAG: hypothetical protein ACREUY_07260, partial [Burkholderiales bacterium]
VHIMKQNAFEFDTSVAAEGFRQIQAANEPPFSQERHDPWLEQFLANARKAFGLPIRTTGMATLAQELEQRGFFGFAHYLDLRAKHNHSHATCKTGPRA